MWANSICNFCVFLRITKNERGGVFYMCQRSKIEAHFPKYPHQPMIKCAGFEKKI